MELVRKKKRRRVSGAGVAAPGRSGMEWMNENRETGIGRPVEMGASYAIFARSPRRLHFHVGRIFASGSQR